VDVIDNVEVWVGVCVEDCSVHLLQRLGLINVRAQYSIKSHSFDKYGSFNRLTGFDETVEDVREVSLPSSVGMAPLNEF
jgi:hypothetical protein